MSTRATPSAPASRRAAWMLAVLGAALLAHGLWIPAKAALAQVLLQHAWERALEGEIAPRPWPWADTWPVARLRVPRLEVELVVLAGTTGEALAFAPGHLDSSAPPASGGHCVLAGHRDTHFAFLRHLRPGDVLELERADRTRQRYVAAAGKVVDATDVEVVAPRPQDILTLVTCYPFEALAPTPETTPGGGLRYVVMAALPDSRLPDPRPPTPRLPALRPKPLSPLASIASFNVEEWSGN